jgi:hypothetical protein
MCIFIGSDNESVVPQRHRAIEQALVAVLDAAAAEVRSGR